MAGTSRSCCSRPTSWLMHDRDGRQLDPADRERPAAVDGLLAAFVSALKVSQVHAWLYVLRRRPAAAVDRSRALRAAGAGDASGRRRPTCGSTGSRKPAAPATRRGRTSGRRYRSSSVCPWPWSLTVLSVVAVFFVPPRRASAWIGILALVGAPAVHMFTLLFLLPAMLLVRREIALVAAILVATFVASYIWVAIVLVAWSLAAMDRWPKCSPRGRPRQPGRSPTSHFVPVGASWAGATLHRPCVPPSLLYGLALAVRLVLICALSGPGLPRFVLLRRRRPGARTRAHGFNVDFIWIFAEVGGTIPADPDPADPLERPLDAAGVARPGAVPGGLRATARGRRRCRSR